MSDGSTEAQIHNPETNLNVQGLALTDKMKREGDDVNNYIGSFP